MANCGEKRVRTALWQQEPEGVDKIRKKKKQLKLNPIPETMRTHRRISVNSPFRKGEKLANLVVNEHLPPEPGDVGGYYYHGNTGR